MNSPGRRCGYTSADITQKHNLRDFRGIFDGHYPAICRLVTGVLGNHAAAEDVVQEAFLKLYQSPPQELTNIRGWLSRVANNIAYNYLRGEKSRCHREAAIDHLPPAGEPEAEILKSEGAAIVRQVLSLLPERERSLLLLKSSGLNYTEIARLLGIKESSVGTLLGRARQKFKAEYLRLKGSDSDVL